MVLALSTGLLFLASALGAVEVGESPVVTAGGPTAVFREVRRDVSPPVRDIPPVSDDRALKISREHHVPDGLNALPEGWSGTVGIRTSEHVLQSSRSARAPMPTALVNVEGLGIGFPGYSPSGVPPDTTGDVGPNHYVQWVNTSFTVLNKDGSVVDMTGNDFRAGKTIWSGFGGPCQLQNDGDPVVLYDQLADRWLMSQFALNNYPNGPFYQCFAVSVTGDPLGSWARYEFQWPSGYLNDYPKIGVWPDGYYLTVNQFQRVDDIWEFRGAGVAVMEREQMLVGGSSQVVYWNLGGGYGSLLPADLDGGAPPPAGSPGFLFALYDTPSNDALDIWEVHVDWTNVGSSTCGDVGNDPNSSISVTLFTDAFSIDQPDTAENLDSLGGRLMFRAPYRNLGTHESIVLNHSVGNPVSGIRWYEIRDPGGTPTLAQEGTYQPDGDERWMGSIAMDRLGNIALGYSVSGAALSPSIRATGRLANDPPGQITFDELIIQTGSGYQQVFSNANRWGDYSTMSVDPVDDCTFWYTQEYVASTGQFVWRTRVAAFAFEGCVFQPSIFADGFETGGTGEWSTATP